MTKPGADAADYRAEVSGLRPVGWAPCGAGCAEREGRAPHAGRGCTVLSAPGPREEGPEPPGLTQGQGRRRQGAKGWG